MFSWATLSIRVHLHHDAVVPTEVHARGEDIFSDMDAMNPYDNFITTSEEVLPYVIVRNANNALIGQIAGGPYLVMPQTTSEPTEVCFSVSEDVPTDTGTYPAWDFAAAPYTDALSDFFVPMNADVTFDEENNQLCGSLTLVVGSSITFYAPVLRVEEYEAVELCNSDMCRVCNGDNSTCVGCEEGVVLDVCGVCDGDGTTCPTCCPGWTGPTCDVHDLCYDVSCTNGGLCDPLTGRCACPVGYTGKWCELPACSENGNYDTHDGKCACYYGWDGEDCSVCDQGGHEKTYLCIPSTSTGYTLMLMPDDDVQSWLNGKKVSGVHPTAAYKKAIYPNTYDKDGYFRNCRCIVVHETTRSRTIGTSTQGMIRKDPKTLTSDGKMTVPHHHRKPPKVTVTNPALTGTVAYRSSEEAQKQLKQYREVGQTIREWNAAIKGGIDLNVELGRIALARVRNPWNSFSKSFSMSKVTDTKMMSAEHPDPGSFGSDVVRAWHDQGSRYWVLRDNEPPFFQETIEQCIDESALSSGEMEDLTEIYQDCIDAFEATNGQLSECNEKQEAYHHSDDDNGALCNSLAIGFWPLLAISILLAFTVIGLFVCFALRPYRTPPARRLPQ